MAVESAHLCRSNPYPLSPCRVTWIKKEREGTMNGDHRPGGLNVSCKANKYSDAETWDLGLLHTHETSLMKITTFLTNLGTSEASLNKLGKNFSQILRHHYGRK